MSASVRARALTKRFGRRTALTGCTLDIPAGHVTGLVGPNGAGKSTLLSLAAGMLAPTSGTIEVCGGRPGSGPEQLTKVGYVAQDAPVYAALTVADHLELGARLNASWDDALARARIERLGLDPRQRAGKLSGGQRAQLALTMGLAKRPELLLLDEPVATLDPLARRAFLQDLMEAVVEHGLSVVLSSHLVADLERVCDRVVVLAGGEVRLDGDVDELLAVHHRLSGPRRDSLPAGQHVVTAAHTERQSTLIVHTEAPILDPAWAVGALTLEDLVLAYMSPPAEPAGSGMHGPGAEGPGERPALEIVR
ncbi:ABC transporter ATP-binding protein [Nonomuraea sp. NPDC049419]|uniref:ABC transporter ATP-binding protein n=1 Tax=Nonomuraea sp. NPDC049419 TaxID=3155772 RepID=UPI003416EAE7